jgi:adenosylcobyric acid synthase
LGWLPVRTVYVADKVTRLAVGSGPDGTRVRGYEIRHGRIEPRTGWVPWLTTGTAGDALGALDASGGVLGTTLHGLFEDDGFRSWFLGFVAARRGRPWRPAGKSYAAARERQIDRIADACAEHLDTDRLWRLVEEGSLSPRASPA